MSVFSFLKKLKVSSLFFCLFSLVACQKSGSLVPFKQKNSSPWSVTERYRPPSFAEGPVKRVLTLQGTGVDQVYVDRQEEEEDYWTQVGLTNEQGSFLDHDIDKRVRYRFGGKMVTPWYDSMKTLVLSSDITLPAKIKGFHCLLPIDVTLYVQDKSLDMNCQYVTILGNIYSFKDSALKDSQGLNAGKIRIVAEEINIQGRIWLLGQNGGEGKSVDKGFYHMAYEGRNGGSGGEIFLQYQNIQEVYESFRVEGGRGGDSGSGIGRERSLSGVQGQRGRVYRKKIAL